AIPFEILFQGFCHVTVIPTRPVFRSKHHPIDERLEVIQSHQVLLGPATEEQTLPDTCPREVTGREQQRGDPNPSRHVQHPVRFFRSLAILFFAKAVSERRKQSDLVTPPPL